MARYPLLFTFRDTVSGKGFVADIAVHGRALMCEEEGGVWVYGVNPGGLAAGGSGKADAYLEFRQDFRSVLYDIAAEAKNFKEFHQEVQSFFDGTNHPTEAEWLEAVATVRAGEVDAPLPKEPADSPRYVEVSRKRKPRPSDNVLEQPRPAMAA